MKALVDKGLSTVQNDGAKVFFTRLWNYTLVKLKRSVSPHNADNTNKWVHLKDKYKGERIFLLGNGPSLNQLPLYLLENEYTMGFNRINLMFERLNWTPDFYMVTDDLVIKDMYKQINEEILPVVKGAFFPDIHPSNVDFTKYIEPKENVLWLNTDQPEFRADLPNCGINKTVVNGAMQVAAFLGFSEIYLVGVDMTFSDHKVKKLNSRNWEAEEKDPNHFDPRYFGKGLKYHNPTVHEMMEKFEQGKVFFDSLGVKVFNAGYGGKLEVFPRVDFDGLFIQNDTEIRKTLTNSKVLKDRNLTLDQLEDAEEVTDQRDRYPDVFRTGRDLGIMLISKLILEYLPLGPYKEQFFFVKR